MGVNMPSGGSRRVISVVNATCGRDARGVSRSSDVTDQTETGSNRGRTSAAGVMPGARVITRVFEKPESGSGA